MRVVTLLGFPGGIALFIMGMRQASDGLRRLAGDHMRQVLARLVRGRLLAFVTGIAATVVFQSSTATMMLLVGFARAELISLSQAMGVILGADIGTTVTVQLVSVHVTDYALLLICLGIIPSLFKTKLGVRSFGDVLVGFGLVLFSMKLMVDTTTELQLDPRFNASMELLAHKPVLSFAVAAILTGALASSAATFGIVLALAQSGAISLGDAMPMVLGANIGTTLTPFWSAAGGGPTAKRVAAAHVLFKMAGVAIVLPFLDKFEALVMRSADGTINQVANAHTFFNVGIGLFFLPLVDLGAWILYKVFKEKPDEGGFRALYLDAKALGEPTLAYACAKQEVLRMGGLVLGMLKTCLEPFTHQDKRVIEHIEAEEDKVDLLNREIKFYLAKVSQSEMTPKLASLELNLVTVVTQLEFMGDVITRNLMDVAEKFMRKGLMFSKEGFAELFDLHEKVSENLALALEVIRDENVDAARKVIRHEAKITEIKKELVRSHVRRLHAGTPESLSTSSMHLELLTSLRWINHYTAQMVDWIAQDAAAPRT